MRIKEMITNWRNSRLLDNFSWHLSKCMENMNADVRDCKGLNVVRASVVITEQMYGKMESICKRQQQACFAASLSNIFLQNFLPVAFIKKLIKCLFVLSLSFWPSLFLGNLLTTWNSMKRTKILWILVVGSWGYIHLIHAAEKYCHAVGKQWYFQQYCSQPSLSVLQSYFYQN